MLLSAKPKGVFSWDFEVFAAGRKLVTIDPIWYRQRGRFVLNLTDFDIVRQGWIGTDFALQVGGKVIVRAAMGLSRRFVVNIAGRQFLLQAAGPLTRKFTLCEDGQVLGSVTPMHPLTRTCRISLPDDLTPPVQIFLIGLVLLMWRRQQSTIIAASF